MPPQHKMSTHVLGVKRGVEKVMATYHIMPLPKHQDANSWFPNPGNGDWVLYFTFCHKLVQKQTFLKWPL